MLKGQSLPTKTERKKEAMDFWLRVATDYNAGMSPTVIATRYINPKTNNNYHVKHIRWILRKLNLPTYGK